MPVRTRGENRSATLYKEHWGCVVLALHQMDDQRDQKIHSWSHHMCSERGRAIESEGRHSLCRSRQTSLRYCTRRRRYYSLCCQPLWGVIISANSRNCQRQRPNHVQLWDQPTEWPDSMLYRKYKGKKHRHWNMLATRNHSSLCFYSETKSKYQIRALFKESGTERGHYSQRQK